jgi:AcrR family transcriptional regulator
MGINERKARDKQEMRKLILSTAMKLFLEEGFRNASIRRIADKIEYSPATIYLYFKDKDEILYALHNEGFEELFKRQQAVLAIPDPKLRLRKQAEEYIKFGLEHPEYYNLMFIMRSPVRNIHGPEEWNAGLRSYDVLRQNLRECIGVIFGEDTNVEIATFALWSTVHGIVSLILRNRCPMIEPDAVPMVAQRALDFIATHLGFPDDIQKHVQLISKKKHG